MRNTQAPRRRQELVGVVRVESLDLRVADERPQGHCSVIGVLRRRRVHRADGGVYISDRECNNITVERVLRSRILERAMTMVMMSPNYVKGRTNAPAYFLRFFFFPLKQAPHVGSIGLWV